MNKIFVKRLVFFFSVLFLQDNFLFSLQDQNVSKQEINVVKNCKENDNETHQNEEKILNDAKKNAEENLANNQNYADQLNKPKSVAQNFGAYKKPLQYEKDLKQKMAQLQQKFKQQIRRPQIKPKLAPEFDFAHGFSKVVEKTLPSVVNISTKQKNNDGKVVRESLGSGFIVDQKGYIVTNNHVIEDSDDINVILYDNSEYHAHVIGSDTKYDIAVLKIKVPVTKKLQQVSWGNSEKSSVGEWVIAIGNPEGFGNTVTHGIISSLSRDLSSRREFGGNDLTDYIQTDASINTGNSGGPLFNINGELIGIVTVIVSETGSNVGLNFAMPSNSIKEVVNQLKKYGKMKRGWIGLQLEELDQDVAESLNLSDVKGAVVVKVIPDSPAFKAGIKQGDIITSINNKKTSQAKTISRLIAELPVDKVVPICLIRDSKKMSFKLTVGFNTEDDDDQDFSSYTITRHSSGTFIKDLGFYVELISDNAKKIFNLPDDISGVMIVKIKKGSSVEDSDIRIGDVIAKVNTITVRDKTHFDQLISEMSKKLKKVALMIYREGDVLYRSIKFKKKNDK